MNYLNLASYRLLSFPCFIDIALNCEIVSIGDSSIIAHVLEDYSFLSSKLDSLVIRQVKSIVAMHHKEFRSAPFH